MRLRSWLVAAVVIVVVAAVAGLVASTHPDGLEYVAERAGFAGHGREGTPVLSGWLGRVVGVLAVLLVGAGLFRLLRPRDRAHGEGVDHVDHGQS